MIDAAELGYVAAPADGHEKFVGRIAIPYLTTTGPIKLRFRKMPGAPEEVPKYQDISGPQGAPRMYNIAALDRDQHSTTVAICEGEFDTLIAEQLGYTAVGLPGATSWQKEWRILLEGFDNVLVFTDNDDKPNPNTGKHPGDELANLIIEELKGQDVRKVLMPQGEDLSSAYLKHKESGGTDSEFKEFLEK